MRNFITISPRGNIRFISGRGPNRVTLRGLISSSTAEPVLAAAPFFTESFTGLNYNNANGFTWSAPNDVTITTFDGYNALLFSYPSGGYFGSEQRFNLGRDVSQLWVEYYVHVPENYVHIDRPAQSDNNKWFMLWRDRYSDIASGSLQVGWEYVPLDGDDGFSITPSGSDIRVMAKRTNLNSITSTDSRNDYAPFGQFTDFISASAASSSVTIQPGKWNQIRLQMKTSTDSSSADGIQRMFVNGNIHNEITTAQFWNFTGSTAWGGTFPDCYFRRGYFMGASNSGFPQETNFYIRDVKFWDENPVWANDYIDSFVTVEKSNMLSNGVDTNIITIQLVKDQEGEYLPIQNINPQDIVVSISGVGNSITQPTLRTNANGITTASFTTTHVSSSKQVSVSVYGVTLNATATVTTDGGTSSVTPSTPFFQEYFANGQKNNNNGFTWSTPNSLTRVSVSNDYAYSGSHSLKFIYGPDADLADSSAEQRFSLGRNLTELWVEYYLRIPENYTQRLQSSGGNNNKFFRIWGDSYSSANKMGVSSQYSASFSEGNSGIAFEYNYKTWADGTLGFGPTGFRSGFTPYGGNSMKGQWTRVRMHYKMVSALNADDALMELWFNDTKVLNFTNVPQKYDTTKPYWNSGYLMGWANSGFVEETNFYIDALKFYDTDPGWT